MCVRVCLRAYAHECTCARMFLNCGKWYSEYLPLLYLDGRPKKWIQSRLFEHGQERGTYDWNAARRYTHVQFFNDRYMRQTQDSFVCKLKGIRIVYNVNQRYSNGLHVKHSHTPVAALKLGKIVNFIKARGSQ